MVHSRSLHVVKDPRAYHNRKLSGARKILVNQVGKSGPPELKLAQLITDLL